MSGATVTVEGTTTVATTSGAGAFSFSGLSPGSYSLLAAKAGHAASRLQSVGVGAGATTAVQMIMRPVFDPAKPVGAPTITVAGLTAGATVSGTVIFSVSVAAVNPVRLIEVRFGQRGSTANLSATDQASSSFSWSTTAVANGASFLNVIAYDNNHNVAELTLPVVVSNAVGGGPPGAPSSAYPTAVTFGQPLNVFAAQRMTLAQSGLLRGDPGRIPLRGDRFLEIQAAPSSASLFVYVLWPAVAGATGYKVYKSFSASGPFALLADAGSGSSTAGCTGVPFGSFTQCYRDGSADLAVGTTVFYRVSAYNAAGESGLSAAGSTTPLGVFSVTLVTPGNEVTGVSPGGPGIVNFIWNPTPMAGTVQSFQGVVRSVNEPTSAWWSFCVSNVTSVSHGSGTCSGSPPATALQPLTRYEWDIAFALAFIQYTTGDAFSMAGHSSQSTPLTSTGSLNGPFHFTTGP